MKDGLRDIGIIYAILVGIPGLFILAVTAIDTSLHLGELNDWPFQAGALIGYLFWLAWAFEWTDTHIQNQRPKPDGYVGRFRRIDGRIVHVARLKDGTLMVASEEAPGIVPKDLGTVTGTELLKWIKLGSTPDGH